MSLTSLRWHRDAADSAWPPPAWPAIEARECKLIPPF